MDWQLAIVCLIVLAATFYLGKAAVRSWRGSKTGCGGSCGCATQSKSEGELSFVPAEQLRVRRR